MSRDATTFRPYARMGWGGRAASHWRGLIETDKNDFAGRTIINRGQIGTVIFRGPGAAVNHIISGVTRDSAGTILSGCRVELFITGRDVSIAEVVSGADGSFAFDNPGTGPFYLVAYKTASPDVAGTTVNTIYPELVGPAAPPPAGPVGEIILSGTTFTAGDLTTGLLGFFEYGVAGYIRFAAGGGGVLAFEFTGTGFSIAAFQGTSSQPTDMVEVSVDGGAFASMGAASGGIYTTSGLSNVAHTIVVRINGAYGDSAGIATTGTVVTIIGGTSITLPRNSQHVTTGLGATIMKTASLVDNAPGTTYDVRIPSGIQSPAKIVRGPAESGKRNNWSTKIRTDATALWIYTEDTFCWVHDGTTLTRYNCNGTGITGEVGGLSKITGLSGLKNYSIWGSGRYNTTIAPFDGDFFTIPTTGVIHEFGDSIAEGTAEGVVGNYGYAAIFQTAVALGRVGGNFGISGNTIANLKARIDSILANVEVTGFDVALITIGRNNADAALDSTEISDYQYIVNACRTKGYGRIICRGVLPESGVPPVNADIASIVTGFADAKIVYYNVNGYTGLDKIDGVHLSVTGMGQLTALAQADLPALIGALP